MTDSILERIKEKDVLYNKIRKSKGGSKNTENYKEKLRDAVRETNRAISIAKKVHFSRQIEKFKNDSQKTWRTISEIINKNRSKTKYPPFFEINGHKVTDKKDIANEFNTYFSTIGQKLADDINTEGLPSTDSYLGNRPNSRFNFEPTTSERVLKILNDLPPKKSSGNDGISSEILTLIKNEISTALSIAINSSIRQGVFPEKLKIARVVPLFKNKGKIWHFENWRPVALLPALFKVYEKEINNQIITYFEKNNLLCENQFGFRSKRSTEDAVLVFHDLAKQMLNQRQTPFAIFMDLSKAFDTLDHSIL